MRTSCRPVHGKLGPTMRARRVELGLTLRRFSTMADLSPAYVSDIELGRRTPSKDAATRIAGVLGVQVSELLALYECPTCGRPML